MARAKPIGPASGVEVDAARWQAVLSTARDAIICIDPGGRVTIFNPAAEVVFGYRAEEVVGRNVSVLMPPPYREEHDGYIEAYRRTGEARAIGRIRSVHARRKNGETFPIELSVSEARAGAEVLYTAIIRDVSERERAAAALRESEYRFQSFMDNSPAVAFLKDAGGRYLYVNRPFERRFGRTLSQVVGRTDFDLFPPSTASRLRANDENVLAADEAVQLVEDVPTPDGVRHDWLAFKFPVLDASGARCVAGMAIDVTERVLAERSLTAQHGVTRVLAEAASFEEAIPQLIRTVSTSFGYDGGKLWVVDGDESTLRLQGTWPDPVPSETLPFSAGAPDVLVEESWRSQAPAWSEGSIAFPIRSGAEIVALVQISQRDGCRPDPRLIETLHVLGTQIGDFLQRKRSERALRELERIFEHAARQADLGAIAARITHDLGNALASISMQAQLLLRRAAREGAPSMPTVTGPAQMIAGEVQRLTGMISEFKDFARHNRLDVGTLEVAPFVRRVADLWGPVARDRRIAVKVDVARDLPAIRADEGKLRRVLDNLVKNAIEAIDPGPGRVVIRADRHGTETLRISVCDSGPGVPGDRDVFRLFETTKAEGSGLGLTIAREIAVAHGGDLSLERRTPHGTAFHLDLPLRGATGSG